MNLELSSQLRAETELDGLQGQAGFPELDGILSLEALGSREEPEAQLEFLQVTSPVATWEDGGRA